MVHRPVPFLRSISELEFDLRKHVQAKSALLHELELVVQCHYVVQPIGSS